MQGIFFSLLCGLLVAIFQIAVIPFLVSYHEIGLVIPCLVLMLVRTRFAYALTFVLMVGFLCDSYTLYGLEFHTVRLLLLFAVSWIVFRRWLTNKSVYTALVLSLLITGLDAFLAFASDVFQGVAPGLAWSWKGFFLALLIHGICSFVVFSFLSFFSLQCLLMLLRL
jgi:hypothetical protein